MTRFELRNLPTAEPKVVSRRSNKGGLQLVPVSLEVSHCCLTLPSGS